MDEQTTPTEPVTTSPDPVVADTPAVEPPQAEPILAPIEPVAVSETPQIELLPEPLPTTSETPTPHLPANEALPETVPEPAPQGAVASVEALEVETTTAPPTPNTNTPEEIPPKADEPPQTQPQQGTAQPKPTPTPASAPVPLPAQAPTETPQNILMLLLTKARLVTQLRKQKKLIKIMGLFAKKTHITNDDVEKLLHVSDATATRYLSELKKQGKILQTGKTGHGVIYVKSN